MNIREVIESAWENRDLLAKDETKEAINKVIEDLDTGVLRTAEPGKNGWQVNDWVKKAVIL